MKVVTSVVGIAQTAMEMRRVKKNITPIVHESLWRTGQRIMTLSKGTYVPVDTGFLKASGVVGQPQGFGSTSFLRLGYGANYAIYVHENLSARHPNGGQAKYLEQAMIDAKKQQWLEKELRTNIARYLGKR